VAKLIHTVVWLLGALRFWRLSEKQAPATGLACHGETADLVTNAISPTGTCGLPANPAPAGPPVTLEGPAKQKGVGEARKRRRDTFISRDCTVMRLPGSG
jgi:hypothetical protein